MCRFSDMLFLLLIASLLATIDGRASPYSHLRAGKHFKANEEDCNSDKLTCVLMKDCSFECPPNFRKVGTSAACYYVFQAAANEERTFTEAQDYCEGIADSLLWIENSQELDELLADPGLIIPVYLNAEYSRDKHAWVWANNDEKIEWNLILQSLPNKATLVTAIENAALNTCFLLNTDTNTIDLVACNEDHEYICKTGKAKGKCTKTGQTKCCYTPSFDFYLRNQQLGHDPGLELGPEGCEMMIGNDKLTCQAVLDAIPLTSVASLTRVGSSYFYFAESSRDCEIREAVISNKRIHEYIMLYMATMENTFVSENVKIGLTFMADGKAHWTNGKSEDFYETYWFPGEPIRDDAVDGGCAAYTRVPDTFTYLWKLFPATECDEMMKICELPVFRSPRSKSVSKGKCGKRRERGVLTKSFYSIYDSDEATFGEFPWHAAVSYYDKIGSGAKRVFACSGALISDRFVLTSAHCISSIRHSDIVVTLGEHDLKDDETLLEPVVFEVTDTIIHPGYGDYHTYSNDIALMQLKVKVNVEDYPHIGLGCLPSPQHIRSHGGSWECFSVGWPKQDYGYRRVLNRKDVSFTSEEYCSRFNYDYYRSLFYEHSRKKYDNSKTAHYYSSSDPELLCTRPNYYSSCMDDQTSILVCKKETAYVERPFFSSSSRHDSYNSEPYASEVYESDTYESEPYEYDTYSSDGYSSDGYSSNTYTSDSYSKGHYSDSKPVRENYQRSARSSAGRQSSKYPRELYKDYHRKVDYILNTYGEERFDSDTWYIIGVGHGLSKCGKTGPRRGSAYGHDESSQRRGKETEIYSSVYEYLPFIHYILDLYHNTNP